MPNRILRDWTDSLRFDGLTADAERLFVRLLMKADDYGRYHANPRLVKAGCFPLSENLRANTVAAWLTELSDRQLVFCYTSGTGEYLFIPKFGQRLKQSRPKFPPPDGKPPDWLPDSTDFPDIPGTSGNFRPDSETETETDTEVKYPTRVLGNSPRDPAGNVRTPSLEQVKAWAGEVMAPAECAECFHADHEARPLAPSGHWTDRDGNPVANPAAAFRGFATRWKSNAAERRQSRSPLPIRQPRPADVSDVKPSNLREL